MRAFLYSIMAMTSNSGLITVKLPLNGRPNSYQRRYASNGQQGGDENSFVWLMVTKKTGRQCGMNRLAKKSHASDLGSIPIARSRF